MHLGLEVINFSIKFDRCSYKNIHYNFLPASIYAILWIPVMREHIHSVNEINKVSQNVALLMEPAVFILTKSNFHN